MGSALSVKNYESPADRRLAGGFLADTNYSASCKLLNLIWTRLWTRITIPARGHQIAAPLRPNKCTHPITRFHSIESHLTRGYP